ncbi:Oidioi.mRNA.OKI2018_I69.chr2.g4141.t1.cds [Oikopleura dioica]|uniref:Oidioi.mRNA.OKI2018_I69.chr2.g4141.t1.cds n=1 Tax=Oikopleura dioica TaxID=34765 RepID=A0ABN7T5G5_OIKDI|nr:Oidioi.mRNA.OKI2018_I69.chr2.g4141.t1.cds [Oikopleura dioica]
MNYIPPRDCLYFKESPSEQTFDSIGFGVVHNQVYYLRRSPDFFQVQTQENQEERSKFYCLGVLHEEDEENNFRDNIFCFIKARFEVELEKNKLYVTEWCKNSDFNELDYYEKRDLYLIDTDADFEEEASDSDDEVQGNIDLEDEGLNIEEDKTTDNSDLEQVDDKEVIDGTDEEEEEEEEHRLLYRVRLVDFLDMVKTDAVKNELVEYKCGEVTKQATCIEISSLPSIHGDDGQLINIKKARKKEVSINWFFYEEDHD